MAEDDAKPDVACTLTNEQIHERMEEERANLAAMYKENRELENGYTLLFEGCEGTLLTVAMFVSNERQCCSFAEYTINASPPFEEIQLTITGPTGTKSLFEHGLIGRLEGES